MVNMQLLVALVVLLNSNGAQASGKLTCDVNKWNGFCANVLAAYNHNEDAIRYLHNDTFEHNRERLRNTNRAISDVLKVEDKSELFKHLHEPMHRELNALSQLTVSCTDETGMELRQCGDALPKVSEATYALAMAVAEVADGSQQKTIKNACEKFYKDVYTEGLNKTVFELAHELGTTVVKAM